MSVSTLLGSQGQDENELKGKEKKETRGKRISTLGPRQEGIASHTEMD